ncbi:malonyl-CoA decarboxylase [Roseibium hamelinense]|uniref:Malonyl-CoA decarboxylase n=1 Tax=Roseibium hamelinense TaxID=150831 RepID=A0A562SUR8_9HYPH|nr:malonyl-CoA decarboxylase [Roseibium hamelinense]MTI43167.1 MCD, Malonyl-CoA decarboxylase MCD [Roseibium hamelinense]TWI84784.1 malonyl-CoA decarboxylase [Roseibium hamelinense]
MNTSFFGELLNSITEQGRALLDVRIGRKDDLPLLDLCEALLSGRGEASGVAIAEQVLDNYRTLSVEQKQGFFFALLENFGANLDAVRDAAKSLESEPDEPSNIRRLHAVTEPRRQELIRRLNLAPGGTRALVDMRADLLDLLSVHPDLRDVDRDFEHLFSSWFNRGFLVMKHIDWSTPASILEKIIRYEAVHEIDGWDDLRRRIGLEDRRLYAFFHPALVDDPLIFVEVALTRDIPAAIAPILAEERAEITASEATTAVFYSISNCQRGLRGISFGNFLIKQVVEELRRELPGLRTYVTLSPVPGFTKWFKTELALDDSVIDRLLSQDAVETIRDGSWRGDDEAEKQLQPLLTSLCAHYLTREKDRKGRTLDPVARFHIGNGARLERVNWLGDQSPNGMAQSYGLMVNYLYDLRYIEKNHETHAASGAVAASSSVTKQARVVPDRKQVQSAS